MRSFATEVEAIVQAPLAQAFEQIVPIDLPSIFKGFGPLPAVTGTRNQTGGWDAAGQTRTVLLSDDSSAQERLTQYQHPKYFAYTVSGFTGILRFFATEAHGQWWFTEGASSTSTSIRWRYAFVSKSALVAPIVWLIANTLWHGYMRRALALSRQMVESHAGRADPSAAPG